MYIFFQKHCKNYAVIEHKLYVLSDRSPSLRRRNLGSRKSYACSHRTSSSSSSSSCRATSTDIPDLSRHFSLSFIASGMSSGLHPVSSHSCCMYVRAGRPAFAWPYAGVHRSISLMSSSLFPQQCPACLVRLTCIVFVMGGRWPYSWCLVECCRQDLFNIVRNILV